MGINTHAVLKDMTRSQYSAVHTEVQKNSFPAVKTISNTRYAAVPEEITHSLRYTYGTIKTIHLYNKVNVFVCRYT